MSVSRRRRDYWDGVYADSREETVSWFQTNPEPSLAMIDAAGADTDSSVIDIGGGASRVVDHLIGRGFHDLSVLDVSGRALERARMRLGRAARSVSWITADVTRWKPHRRYDIWHDRAAFHFLTEQADRLAYFSCVKAAIARGGHVILATFAEDGPLSCSGLPVMRYSPESLSGQLGLGFELRAFHSDLHETPGGARQSFQFSLFQRVRD